MPVIQLICITSISHNYYIQSKSASMEELETPTSSIRSFNLNPNLQTAGAKAEPQVATAFIYTVIYFVRPHASGPSTSSLVWLQA